MKKIVSLVLMSSVALFISATDRFYIEDFEISPGETRTVSILLDNEAAYTAFQADLYLPEGLSVDEDSFELTERKSSNHTLSVSEFPNRVYRLMAYSVKLKTFSGNSGALVTFDVTASSDFESTEYIKLKKTLFTTEEGVEISFNDETCLVTPILKDLTGEIVITPIGSGFQVLGLDDEELHESYDSVVVCYTGPEDVHFSIIVNGYDLFDNNEEYNFEDAILWDGVINGYRIDLYDLMPIGYVDEYWYSGKFDIEVTVSANGYKELHSEESVSYYTMAGLAKPSIETEHTDYTLVIRVQSTMSGNLLLVNGEVCDLNGGYSDEDYEDPYYIIERTESDSSVTIQAACKTMMMTYFVLSEEFDIQIPAINNGISINQCGNSYFDEEENKVEDINNKHYLSIYYYGDSGLDPVEQKYASNYADLSVTINGQQVVNDQGYEDDEGNYFYNNCFIDMLPYATNDYGGEFHVQVNAFVYDYYTGSHTLFAEATFEYYLPIDPPSIETSLSPDNLIIDVNSTMSNIVLMVDGKEVAYGPGEEYNCRYEVPRLNEDYYITVQAGHMPMYYDDYVWSEEETVLVPALLRGDVNEDESVTIADVTALIDYLLRGESDQYEWSIREDVNLDDRVSILDVTVLIDYLLSGKWPEPTPEDPGVQSFTVNGVTFKMIEVDGGTFTMGATPDQGENPKDNEKPVHQVTLSSFSIGETEVTQELWEAVMGTNPSNFKGNLQRPVEKVSWNQCQQFISQLNALTGQNFRLPTEAEWEFAARGGVKTQAYMYAGGNTIDDVAWYYYNAYAVGSSSPDYGTHTVATKAPNELGLYDITGNVWEWCQDWFGNYSEASQTNPTGPESGTNHVIRGGGWTNYPSLLRIAARANYNPSFTGNFIGLRLAL